jgi:hypothetical protein
MIGMILLTMWATGQIGLWTWVISMPLCAYAGHVAAAMDHREDA